MSAERDVHKRRRDDVTVLLVADDLTGAADASVPFLSAGLRVTVAIDPALCARGDDAAKTSDAACGRDCAGEAFAVSTNSRDLPRQAACRAVRDTIESLGSLGSIDSFGSPIPSPTPAGTPERTIIRFKKIDSGLRGQPAAETLTAMHAWNCARAVVAPAFPEQQRTIVDSQLRIDGVASGLSMRLPFEREAFHSVLSVSETIASTEMLSALAQALASETTGAPASKGDPHRTIAILCDATQASTLDASVAAFWPLRHDTLWVGSAGLARALARRIGAERHLSAGDGVARSGGDDDGVDGGGTNARVVGGTVVDSAAVDGGTADGGAADLNAKVDISVAAVSSSSAAAASTTPRPVVSLASRRRGCALFIGSMTSISMRQCAELESGGGVLVDVNAAGQRAAAAALTQGRDVLVRMRKDAPARLLAMVKAVAAAMPAGIVLSGGDSASRVCRAAGVSALALHGEMETGIPWGLCAGGDFDGLPVLLKSGAFGGPDTLLRAARFLTTLRDVRPGAQAAARTTTADEGNGA